MTALSKQIISSRFIIWTSGLLISFLGTLPAGTLNLTAFQLAAGNGAGPAMLFVYGVIIIELTAVIITLFAVQKINFEKPYFRLLIPAAVLFLFYLAFINLIAVTKEHIPGKTTFAAGILDYPFLLGILLSLTNPLQFPFWIGWNSILIAKKRLNKERWTIVFYLTGIGMGTLGGFLLFILAGKFVPGNFESYSHTLNYIMAGIYSGTGIYLIIRSYKQKSKSKIIKSHDQILPANNPTV